MTDIRFACSNPECGKQLRAKAKIAGTRHRCPACGALIYIPPISEAMVENRALVQEDAPEPELKSQSTDYGTDSTSSDAADFDPMDGYSSGHVSQGGQGGFRM